MKENPQVQLPASLTAQQRAALHSAAEEAGISHASRGEGAARHLVLGDAGRPQVHVEDTGRSSDAQLCELLRQHFDICAEPFFASSSGHAPDNGRTTERRSAVRAAAGKHQSDAALTLDSFVASTLPLLDLERDAEIAQTQEALGSVQQLERASARGRVLLNLRCAEVEGGLLGRTLLTLVSNKGGGTITSPLPPHKFSAHDVVDIRFSKAAAATGPALASGVVYRVKDGEVIVAIEDLPEDGLNQPLRLEKLTNEVTYKRLRETLKTLSTAANGQTSRAGRLPEVLFGGASPRFVSTPPTWQPLNRSLDASQLTAVGKALAARDVALIHGPPGTGKTTAVVELILQEAARGNKVLAAAASNMAVDNLVERLANADPKMLVVRVGHPARLLPQVLDCSLEAHVLRSDNSALAKDCRSEIKAANARLLKLARKDRAERKALRAEIRALSKEERQRQQKAVNEVLSRAAVVCSTLTGTLSHHLGPLAFDTVVIDEAAQALEAASWSALLKAPKAVLAGDHLQLPPTVISDAAAKRGLGRTLFERLQALFGESVSTMLTVQYRMNAAIMEWSSRELYNGRVVAHASVAQHTLQSLEHWRGGSREEFGPLLLIDTAGCDMEEDAAQDGDDSKHNLGEAAVALEHCRRLVAAGLQLWEIGVITPYNAQVALLKDQRPPELANLEIGTVDGFQGREKEAIVISMVRSNTEGGVGFLADNRRMNVAVTRARRHCALICDSETVSHDLFLKRLVGYFEDHGCYICAAELQ